MFAYPDINTRGTERILDRFCKPSTSSRVCITVSNSPNPSRGYIRLLKHGKRLLLLKCHLNAINALANSTTFRGLPEGGGGGGICSLVPFQNCPIFARSHTFSLFVPLLIFLLTTYHRTQRRLLLHLLQVLQFTTLLQITTEQGTLTTVCNDALNAKRASIQVDLPYSVIFVKS